MAQIYEKSKINAHWKNKVLARYKEDLTLAAKFLTLQILRVINYVYLFYS